MMHLSLSLPSLSLSFSSHLDDHHLCGCGVYVFSRDFGPMLTTEREEKHLMIARNESGREGGEGQRL